MNKHFLYILKLIDIHWNVGLGSSFCYRLNWRISVWRQEMTVYHMLLSPVTKRNFWRRYDDVYPKVQIHFHFYSKSAIKNALEQVLGPFTSNPEQVKKINFWGTGKFQDPLLEISRPRPEILCLLENSRTPSWKIPGPNQWLGHGYF